MKRMVVFFLVALLITIPITTASHILHPPTAETCNLPELTKIELITEETISDHPVSGTVVNVFKNWRVEGSFRCAGTDGNWTYKNRFDFAVICEEREKPNLSLWNRNASRFECHGAGGMGRYPAEETEVSIPFSSPAGLDCQPEAVTKKHIESEIQIVEARCGGFTRWIACDRSPPGANLTAVFESTTQNEMWAYHHMPINLTTKVFDPRGPFFFGLRCWDDVWQTPYQSSFKTLPFAASNMNEVLGGYKIVSLKTPGFEVVFAIAIFIVVAYFLTRRAP